MPLSEETRRRLAACSSATLSTQLFKRGLRNQVMQGVPRLTPKAPTMVGEAFTLRNIPAREDLDHIGVYDNPEHPQRKAIEIAPPGSVLVIDCREDALRGETHVRKQKRIAQRLQPRRQEMLRIHRARQAAPHQQLGSEARHAEFAGETLHLTRVDRLRKDPARHG